MILNRLAAAAAVGLAGGALLLAAPAQAQDEHYPSAGWQVRQIGIGDTDWSPATASTVVDATTVALTKPDGTTGTSIETTDLGLAVTADTSITVSYELAGGADVTAGAVRLFYYDFADADTLTVAPTAFVAADGSGTLSLTVLADGTIGTFGLVYDASNVTAGTVTFTGLTVGATTVLFEPPPEPCQWDESLLADDEKCLEPLPTPSTPAATPSTDPSPASGVDADGELPTTGSNLLVPLLTVGAAAGVAGGSLLWLARFQRRRAIRRATTA